MYFFTNKKEIRKNKFKGFTLVEILVVLGLFSTVITIAVGALFTTQAINTKLQETQSVLDNVNLSMETMTRDIRYGSSFHCDVNLSTSSSTLRKDCAYSDEGGTILFFKPEGALHDTDRVAYYASSTQFGNVILKDEYIDGATTTYQITGNDVTIKTLVFYVTGANTSSSTDIARNITKAGVVQFDYIQPLITLTVAGETKTTKATTTGIVKFTVQTSISPRQLDN